MRAVLLLVAVLACGGLVWYLTQNEREAPEDDLPHPGEAIPEAIIKPHKPMALLEVVVVPEEPADLWGSERPVKTIIEDRQKLETMIRWPKDMKELTGEDMLKGMQTAFGTDHPFRFAGKGFEEFKKLREPMPPPMQEPVMEIIARITARGWELIERDGGIWIISVEGREEETAAEADRGERLEKTPGETGR